MYNRQQRRRAMLVLCIVALGIAMLCFACVHLADHPCCGTRACAICGFLRLGLRPSVLRVAPPMLVAAALAVVFRPIVLLYISHTSLCALRVRLND